MSESTGPTPNSLPAAEYVCCTCKQTEHKKAATLARRDDICLIAVKQNDTAINDRRPVRLPTYGEMQRVLGYKTNSK